MKMSDSPDKTLDLTVLMEKAGGAFKLSSLMQKRMRELAGGDRPLVKTDSKDLFVIAAEEILQGKINLIPSDDKGKFEVVDSGDFSDD